eukprot:scaffold83691_cov45-Tisochrysis_lutea.AAC.1
MCTCQSELLLYKWLASHRYADDQGYRGAYPMGRKAFAILNHNKASSSTNLPYGIGMTETDM